MCKAKHDPDYKRTFISYVQRMTKGPELLKTKPQT